MLAINLWNPKNLDLLSAFIVSFLLGVVHGITPDEHTWPITFSYAIGTGTTKGGAKAGLLFSSGFTLQRAILSEIAYWALPGIFLTSGAFGLTYILVGAAMAAAGIYMSKYKDYFHFHYLEKKFNAFFKIHKIKEEAEKGALGAEKGALDESLCDNKELCHERDPVFHESSKPIPLELAFFHGLIAGFGFGAFALILFTVISPSMPSPYLGFVPGLLFGIGTMSMQVLMGSVFGAWLSKRKKLTPTGIAFVGKTISSYILTYGGVIFAAAGTAVLLNPAILRYGITTRIKVHNLHTLGIGFFLVILVVGGIGLTSYFYAIKKAEKLGYKIG